MSGATMTMELRVKRTDEGLIELRLPDVGEVSGLLARGATLAPGMVVGTLLRLGRSIDLVVPHGAGGLVTSDPPSALRAARGFDECVYALDPAGVASVAEAEGGAAAALEDGSLVVRATQPGRVWLCPTPGDPPFAPVGKELENGAALCLVEVMKTFSTLAYRATGGLPARAKVVRWLIEDGADVEPGTALLAVREG